MGLVCLRGQRCVDPSRLDGVDVQRLLPPQNATLPSTEAVTFGWRDVSGAAAYSLYIWRDAALTDAVADSPFVVYGTSTTRSLPAGTYYWRVVSDVTASDVVPSTGLFGVVDDTLYVYCAGADDCVARADVPELGTKSQPFRSIGRAVTAATAGALSNIAVATRDDGASYRESVTAVSGISIRGGFDPAFEQRSGRTRVVSAGASFVATGIVTPTVIHGLAFTNDGTALSVVARIAECDEALTISDTSFSAVELRQNVVEVYDGAGSVGPLFQRVDIATAYSATRTDDIAESRVVAVSNAALRLEDSTLDARGSGRVMRLYGIKAEQADVSLERTSIHVEGAQSSYGIDVENDLRDAVRFVDVTVDAVGSSALAYGIGVYQAASLLISRCTVRARGAGWFTGIAIGNSTALIEGSVIATGDSSMAVSTNQNVGIVMDDRVIARVVNNTVVTGHARAYERGILLRQAYASLVNNLLISRPANSDQMCVSPNGSIPCRIGVHELPNIASNEDVGQLVAKFNNTFVGYGGSEHVRNTGHLFAANTGRVENDGNSDCTAPASSNLYVSSIAYATANAPAGSDGLLATADDILTPAASEISVAARGQSTPDDVCKPSSCNDSARDEVFPFPAPSCGGTTTDRTGTPFPTTPPVGAFLPQ